MQQVLRRLFSGLTMVFTLFAAMGCGKAGIVKLEGRIVKDGQPFTPRPEEKLSLSFSSMNAAEAATYPAKVNEKDSSFVVLGPSGKGIPPGNYKVYLSLRYRQLDPEGAEKLKELNQTFDAINGKEIELTDDGNRRVSIDVGKGTISN